MLRQVTKSSRDAYHSGHRRAVKKRRLLDHVARTKADIQQKLLYISFVISVSLQHHGGWVSKTGKIPHTLREAFKTRPLSFLLSAGMDRRPVVVTKALAKCLYFSSFLFLLPMIIKPNVDSNYALWRKAKPNTDSRNYRVLFRIQLAEQACGRSGTVSPEPPTRVFLPCFFLSFFPPFLSSFISVHDRHALGSTKAPVLYHGVWRCRWTGWQAQISGWLACQVIGFLMSRCTELFIA